MLVPISLGPTNIRDLECQFKFYTLRVMKEWPTQRTRSPYLIRGQSAHFVLAELFNPKYGDTPPHMSRLEEALRQAVAAEPNLDDYSRKMAADWIRSLVNVYVGWRDPGRKVLAVEQWAEFPLHFQGTKVANVSARLDRLEVHEEEPDTLIVIDLSMGDKVLTSRQVWMDLAVGKHLFRGQGFARHVLEIQSISSEAVQTTSYRGGDVKGVHLKVGDMAAEFQAAVERGMVQATLGEACLYCALKTAGRCPLMVPVDIETLGFDDEEDDNV
ncbi:MAG: hypothetical protein JWL77_3517 [Chthonomonadaceae bacterium]|nr:hypothetical protein [Chthonomonadaceae bacterium]